MVIDMAFWHLGILTFWHSDIWTCLHSLSFLLHFRVFVAPVMFVTSSWHGHLSFVSAPINQTLATQHGWVTRWCENKIWSTFQKVTFLDSQVLFSWISDVPTTKYMTLGPKFFCWRKMTITRRRKHLNQEFRKKSKAQDISHHLAVSKQDLTQFSNSDLLGFAAHEIFEKASVNTSVNTPVPITPAPTAAPEE